LKGLRRKRDLHERNPSIYKKKGANLEEKSAIGKKLWDCFFTEKKKKGEGPIGRGVKRKSKTRNVRGARGGNYHTLSRNPQPNEKNLERKS